MNKEERMRERARLSNIVTNKMMVVFFALIFAVVLLLKLSGSAVTELSFYRTLPYLQIVSALLTGAAVAWYAVCKKRGVDAKERVFSAPMLLGLAASLLFTTLFYTGFGGAFRIILSLFAFALLFFVYQIYPIDFFLCSVAVVVGCISASMINSAGFNGVNVLVNCFAVACTLAAAFGGSALVTLLAKHGKVTLCGVRLKKPRNMNALLVYIGCAAAVLAVFGVLVFGHLLYWAAAAIAVYFAIAIIYTVKLM